MAFANFSLTTAYATIISMLNTQLTAVGKLFKDQTTGDFADQIRYNSSSDKLEYWTGSAWATLPMTGTAAGTCTGNAATATSAGTCTGNAATATTLQTARTIGGVSFNGSANINLPGVNTTGNQNTTGSSSSCTGNAATSSSCTGNAATATTAANGGVTSVNSATGAVTVSGIFSTQTWQSVTRSNSTTYTNSTGQPIFLHVAFGAFNNNPAAISFYINGTLIYTYSGIYLEGALGQSASFIIPNGATYKISTVDSGTWVAKELR